MNFIGISWGKPKTRAFKKSTVVSGTAEVLAAEYNKSENLGPFFPPFYAQIRRERILSAAFLKSAGRKLTSTRQKDRAQP